MADTGLLALPAPPAPQTPQVLQAPQQPLQLFVPDQPIPTQQIKHMPQLNW